MTPLFHSFANWLADYYLLSGVLLACALVALAAIKQPAQRRAVTQSTLIALCLLAVLCAVPGWSMVSLITSQKTAPADEPLAQLPNTKQEKTANKALTDQTSVVPLAPPATRQPSSSDAVVPDTARQGISWPAIAVLVWLAGALSVVFWLALGMLAARRLRRNSHAVPMDLVAILREVTDTDRSDRLNVDLRMSEQLDVAVALGIQRPAVLLPAKWIPEFPLPFWEGLGEGLSRADLRTILAHEAAHIRNNDLHWLAVSRALTILLWAQPFYWFVRRRMRLDQEALADAAAAELTSRQRYAEHLVAWARDVATRPAVRLSSAVGLWEGPSQLRRRVALLLDEHFTMLRHCPRRWQATAIAVCTLAVLGLSLVTLEPVQSEPVKTAETPAANASDPEPSDQAKKETPSTATAYVTDSVVSQPNTVTGRVVDENDQSISGAEVFLFRINRHDSARRELGRETTDADGKYRFADVIDIAKEFPDGKFPTLDDPGVEFLHMVIRAAGRVSESWLEVPQLVAQAGEFQHTRLLPAATLSGQVTAPDGTPVSDALVSVGFASLERWEGAKSARTDANGKYVIDDVAPFDMEKFLQQKEADRRRLEESKRAGNAFFSVWRAQPTLVVEHPDFAVRKAAYEKIPGTTDVQLEPPAELAGRVVYDDTGKPAAGVVVQLATVQRPGEASDPAYSFHQATARTNAQGEYLFQMLPAGAYTVWTHTENWVNAGISELDVAASKRTSAPDLTFTKGVVVSVRLVDKESREPIVLPAGSKAHIGAQPLAFRMRPGFSESVAASADGKFEIRTLPGENRIWVGGIMLGDKQWMGQEPVVVDLIEGKATSVDLPIIGNDARVTGTVQVAPRQEPRDIVETLTRKLMEYPDDAEALLSRGVAWQMLGEYANAVADYERVITLAEKKPVGTLNFVAHNNLALVLSTAPDDSIRDGTRAVALAKKAQQLQPEPIAGLFDTLASAYAEAGDFDKAIESQQKAIELKPEIESFRQHLKLYQAKKPRRGARPANTAPAKNEDQQEEQGSKFLRELRAKAAPLLAAMATEHGYGLPPGTDLARVAPPFAPIRMEYYRTAHPGQANAIRRGPEAMMFRWVDGRLLNWGMLFGDPEDPGYSVTGLLDAIVDLHSQSIEGPEELLNERLPGDWVVRPGADKAQIITQLQQILQNELSLPVSMELREVKRRVYVARGKYQLSPLPGQRGQDKQTWADETFTTDEIQVFGKQLVPNSGAGGVGSFDEFLNWLGRWVGTPVVSDVDTLPANKLSWHLHERSPSTEQTREEDHDAKLVLPNITAQTGLVFALEVRPIEILFVDHFESADDIETPQR